MSLQPAARAETARAVVTRAAFVRRNDSTVSEPSLPPAAFVFREESRLRLVRGSEEFALSISVARGAGRSGGLWRRRRGVRRRPAEVTETRVAVQATS